MSDAERLRWSLAGLAAGLAILLVVLGASGATLDGLGNVVAGVPWGVWPAIALTYAILLGLAAWKWRIVLAETLAGRTVPPGTALSATATGALLGQVISIQVSTPIVRAWAARRHGIGARAAAGTSLFEQALELLTLALAAAASVVLAASGERLWAAALALVVLLAVGTALLAPLLRLGAAILRALPFAPAAMLADALAAAAAQRPAILRQLMALSLMRYVLLTALNVGVLMILVPGLDPVALAVVFPLILLVSSIPFLPAGLGLAEATWAGALALQGVDAVSAAEAALALRIVTLTGFVAVYPLLALAGRRDAGGA